MLDTGPNSRSSELVVSAIVTVAVSGVIVGLRFLTRIRILQFLGGEDWCIGVAYVLSVGNSIGMTYQAKFALGRRLATLSPDQISSCLKAYYATVLCYFMSLTFTKISILLQYQRIFKAQKLVVACYTLMTIVALFGLEVFITSTIPCWPVAAFWDFTIKGKCFFGTSLWFANAALNIATDLVIFMLPIPVIKGLNLPKRQKVALLIVFMLGFFVCIISILRIPSLQKAAVSTDFSYDNIGIAVWSCVEINVAILCACLPTLKPLISCSFPGLLSGAKQSSRSRYLRYGSNRDLSNRGTWSRRKSSKFNSSVDKKTVGDSESGTGIVTIQEDIDLEFLELEARREDTRDEFQHSRAADTQNEISERTIEMGTGPRSVL